jgi:ATP-dependent exoDNAse (exonuclease V) alpha subunit
MPVIITENVHTSLGLVNGKEGTTVGVIFDPTSEIVPIAKNVYLVSLPPIAVIIKLEAARFKPLRGLELGMVPIFRKSMKVFLGKAGKTQVQRVQVPLTPAYAITEYRSQGRTFENLVLDLETRRTTSRQKDFASIYVSLSRAKSICGVSFLRPVMGKTMCAKPGEYMRVRIFIDSTIG